LLAAQQVNLTKADGGQRGRRDRGKSMGLLDDLKRQAESRKAEEQTNQAEKNRNLQAVDGALRGILRYFTELTNSQQPSPGSPAR